MLGWEVFVYPEQSPDRVLLARWTTAAFGIGWIDALVREKKAEDLGGDGYPCRYSIPAGVLLPILRTGLPAHSTPTVVGDDYVLPPGYQSRVEFDPARFSECRAEERLTIEAWDRS